LYLQLSLGGCIRIVLLAETRHAFTTRVPAM